MYARFCALALVGLAAAGCASHPEFSSPPPKQLVLEQAFIGRTLGEGVLVNSFTGGETTFSVVITGSWDGRVLTLVENFLYGDGTKDRKTWKLTKLREGQYQGEREDVIGTANVHQDNQGVRLDYYVTLDTSFGKIDVRFRDLLYLQNDGTIRNKAVVSKLGLKVGRVDITMHPNATAN
jgi:hypothetical protein